MRQHHIDDDTHHYSDFDIKEDPETLNHRKQVRRMLEDRLERKRLRADIQDDFKEDEFDWDDWDR